MFDTPYALPKLDIVALPHFVFQAMENWVRQNRFRQALLCTARAPQVAKRTNREAGHAAQGFA